MTSAQIQAALASMPAEERATRLGSFTSSRYLVISYQRYFQPVGSNGRPSGAAIRLNSSSSVAQLAAVAPLGVSADGLYISVAATYDSSAPAYRWDLSGYWQWSSGGDYGNSSQDHIALSWGGGLGVLSAYAYGYYKTTNARITTTQDHASPSGIDDRFPEWGTYCDGRCVFVLANWGYTLATVSETNYQNYQTDVDLEYVHTYTSGAVTMSFGYPAPSISVSPADNNWSLATFAPVKF